MNSFFAFGIGTGSKNSRGQWLEVFFPTPQLGITATLLAIFTEVLAYNGENQFIELSATKAQALAQALQQKAEYKLATTIEKLAYSKQSLVMVLLKQDTQSVHIPEIYLKLQLVSHRLLKPQQLNLTNILNHLPIIAWTNHGAIDVEDLAERQLQARLNNQHLQVFSIDRLPPMTNYVAPSDISIADSARVYLGAYIGAGTIVMRDGFVDFNAGAAGNNVITGSISTGFFVGENTQLASASSTLSRRANDTQLQFSIGENCYIGAHAGVGIALGNNCTIEDGIHINAETEVFILASNSTVKAKMLANSDNLLFRYNTIKSVVEVIANR